MTTLPKWYLAIDIEGRGDSLYNPITAIGVFLAPVDEPAKGVKKRWALAPLPGQTDDESCKREFWAKFPEVDKWIVENARPAHTVMAEFQDWCRNAVAEAGGPRNITILSDCMDYDLGRLDYTGHATGTWDKPVRHLGVGVRHWACDPSERLEQINGEEEFKAWLPSHVKHSHFPDDDAEYCYYMQVFCDEKRVILTKH